MVDAGLTERSILRSMFLEVNEKHKPESIFVPSDEFVGLDNDPILCVLFDLITDISNFSYAEGMWCLSDKLEESLDEILKYKDQKDRGVGFFKSSRSN